MKCLEDELQLACRDADAVVADRKGDDGVGARQLRMIRTPSRRSDLNRQGHASRVRRVHRREFEGIGKQILQYLLKADVITAQRWRQPIAKADREPQAFL